MWIETEKNKTIQNKNEPELGDIFPKNKTSYLHLDIMFVNFIHSLDSFIN